MSSLSEPPRIVYSLALTDSAVPRAINESGEAQEQS
jgi:hypothetical protein